MKLLSLLPLLAVLGPALATDASEAYLECPDSEVTTHLLSLIDVLYANGLTIFEELLAHISETDSGYALLSSWASTPYLTILAPTDAAFQQAGIWGPFEHQTESQLVDLVSLHTLQGQFTWDKLPLAPLHGIANTNLRLPGATEDQESEGGWQSMVMVREENNAIVVKTAYGNATTWNGALNLAGTALTNIAILPVDNIIENPPKLGDALHLGTTTRSPNGMPQLKKAFSAAALDLSALEAASGGITVFAPVDDSWNADVLASLSDKDKAAKLVGNHYVTGEIIFSPTWFNSGSYPSLAVASGASLSLTYNGTGHYVTLGTQTAEILRSDITLDNGVMHIIDQVLVASGVKATANSTVGGGAPQRLDVGSAKPSAAAASSTTAAAAPSGSGKTGQGQGSSTSGAGLSVGISIASMFGVVAAFFVL